jgi:hypothetical protein
MILPLVQIRRRNALNQRGIILPLVQIRHLSDLSQRRNAPIRPQGPQTRRRVLNRQDPGVKGRNVPEPKD